MIGYKLLAVLEEIPGSKGKPPRSLVEYTKGRAKPVVRWYNRYTANSIFGIDQMVAARGQPDEEVVEEKSEYLT
jgi:hypothetical protein